MFKGENIKGYKVLQDFSTAGGGLSKWTFVDKAGTHYFMKEFLAPKYPTPDSPGSNASKQRKKEECERFEAHHLALMKVINEKCAGGGNLVFTIDFFRHYSKYYKVTEKVDVSSLTVSEIAVLPLLARVLILKTIVHSLAILHSVGIVHGDLKPDNVLIKQTKTSFFTSKLIDFDNSYFEGKPPEMPEDVVGDMAYYSPELAAYIAQNIEAKHLRVASDIFALGLLFWQYLTGKMPAFDKEKYQYASHAVANDEVLVLQGDGVPMPFVSFIGGMLQKDYKKRPNANEVNDWLKNIDLSPYLTEEDKRKPATLVSKMNLKADKTTKEDAKVIVSLPKKDELTGIGTGGLRGKGLKIGDNKE